MVATMDLKESVKYFSAVTAHKNGEELSNKLIQNVVMALKCYREEHGRLPSRILFYRDGVGDGQVILIYYISILMNQYSNILFPVDRICSFS
jgi:aubergine-like protein